MYEDISDPTASSSLAASSSVDGDDGADSAVVAGPTDERLKNTAVAGEESARRCEYRPPLTRASMPRHGGFPS
jgi:hypothetical protein